MKYFIVQLRVSEAPDADVPVLPLLRRASLRDEVAAALEARILDGSFAEGSRLPTEAELTQTFGVSRTVVRDALRILEARGLVAVRRGSGTTVTGTSVDAYATAVATMLIQSELTLGDVFEARSALEGQLALIAAEKHTAAHAERMVEALEAFAAAVRTRDHQSIVRTHVELHTEIVRATNLPALAVLLQPIQQMMAATSVVGRDIDPADPRAWRVRVHRDLVEAIASRDLAAVARANAAHWSAAIRGDGYREIRSSRVGELFPSPRDLLRDLELGDA